MKLADFIEADLDGLIDAWAEYALAISQEDTLLSESQLRNSAAEILTAIAADMRTAQNATQQEAKSRGDDRAPQSEFNRVAHHHAEDRLAHGFGINDVVAEFRALRATVLRHWHTTSPEGAAAFQEMIRFNEAVDQVLAESVRHYAAQTERSRDLFNGVLAHDLRSPLAAILNAGEVLLHDNGLSSSSVRAIAFVQRSATRMKQMIDDLLIFTRARLGDTLPISFASQDIGRICGDAADEVRASYPDATIDVRLAGDLRGRWDGARIGQLMVNLLTNAARYGSGGVVVEADGREGHVTIVVSNEGNPIPEKALPTLFDPLTRANSPERSGSAAGIGLGLYICRCIVRAHQGTIAVASSERGTSFTVHMPCSPSLSG
ncbi:sensor histidine kinase [Paraburkholderia sp. SUR17]|uniref:sensor histidine kinase n=1 Tax=Paraburkholderia sp. SUR17 TaxID=3034358 RepID=UPI002407FED0|nr:sensor histidine kinase [Paraburkholderia sp. SUR17]WEY41371.1 sensor histidine kinase [Paraburkholderia sp. SUR17]